MTPTTILARFTNEFQKSFGESLKDHRWDFLLGICTFLVIARLGGIGLSNWRDKAVETIGPIVIGLLVVAAKHVLKAVRTLWREMKSEKEDDFPVPRFYRGKILIVGIIAWSILGYASHALWGFTTRHTEMAKAENPEERTVQKADPQTQKPVEKQPDPCPKKGAAIVAMAPGNFDNTKINEGPCDTGILTMPGSNGSEFKGTTINHGVPDQNPKKSNPKPRKQLCTLNGLTLQNYDNGGIGVLANVPITACDVTFESSTKAKPAPASPPAGVQDNSVHIGNDSTVAQQSNGDCSPNIIGGSSTVNCAPPPPPPLSFQFSQQEISSTDKKFAFETKVTITPNREFTPVSLAIICDVPVRKVDPTLEGARTLREVAGSLSADDPNIGLVEIGDPPSRPDRPVVALVFSDAPLRVLNIQRAKITNPVFPQ